MDEKEYIRIVQENFKLKTIIENYENRLKAYEGKVVKVRCDGEIFDAEIIERNISIREANLDNMIRVRWLSPKSQHNSFKLDDLVFIEEKDIVNDSN